MNGVTNDWIKQLAYGPFRLVATFPGHFVNGYKFHTVGHGSHRSTMNSGVCVKGANYGYSEGDYHGRLLEVVRLEYPGLPMKKVVLFNCEWFDPTPLGTMVHPQYNLVDINHRRRFRGYEPFILATQATQVYYCTYPSLRRDKLDWWGVCKVKARSTVQFIDSAIPPSFQEEAIDNHDYVQVDDEEVHLNDIYNDVIDLGNEDTDEEINEFDETDDDSDNVNIGNSESE